MGAGIRSESRTIGVLMPYSSKAQARYFHAAMARGEIKKSTVKEFDKSTNFKKLASRVYRKKK